MCPNFIIWNIIMEGIQEIVSIFAVWRKQHASTLLRSSRLKSAMSTQSLYENCSSLQKHQLVILIVLTLSSISKVLYVGFYRWLVSVPPLRKIAKLEAQEVIPVKGLGNSSPAHTSSGTATRWIERNQPGIARGSQWIFLSHSQVL